MKKFFLSSFVFVASAAYVAFQYFGGSSSSAVASLGASAQTQVALDTSAPVASVPAAQTPPSTTTTPVVAQTPTVTPTPTPTLVSKPVTTTTHPLASTPAPTSVSTPTPIPVATPTPTPTSVVTQTPAPKPAGQYADGTYTGAAENAFYGTVQVQAVIQGGRLVTVTFLQYPNDRSNSIRINTRAMPTLQQEAIAAQSANVSGASGASYTSAAFKQSLGDALSQAKNS